MADQIVFLVPGMGVYADGWHKPWVKTLEDAYNSYPLLQKRPFTTRFDFVPINPDTIYQKIVAGWQERSRALAAVVTGGLVSKLTSWLTNAGELKDNFGWTHAGDVLQYRLLNLVREWVCVAIADEIKQKLVKVGPGLTWSIIGHSLGTAMVHDTIARLWANDSVFRRDYQARLIAMVANVSRVLEQKDDLPPGVVGDALLSPVRPGVACNYFLNLEHPLDPFVWPRRFHPMAWPDAATLAANPPRYIHSADEDINGRSYALNHVHGAGVHDFEHYLASPKAHIPLFRMLLAEDGFISAEEERRARDRFPQFGKLGDELAIKIKKQLEDIGSSERLEWEDIGVLWGKLERIRKAFS